MTRALGVVRLSRHSKREDDPSTSPERQRQHILNAAAARGDQIIGWAEDLGVSAAKVPPWNRPELGLWLPDLKNEHQPVGGKPEEFDVIYFWKLDRLVRSVNDFSKIVTWANLTKKNLVSSDGAIDLSTPMGRAMAQIVAVFAELEAAIIKERVNDARKEILSQGRVLGGRYPWGYKPEKQSDGGYRLEIDPDTHPLLQELVTRVSDGEPMNAVAADFDRRGIPTPKGGESWHKVAMGKILRSRNLLGEFELKEEVEGVTVTRTIQRAEPLITHDEYASLQTALGTTTRRRTGASLLLDIAFCSYCGKKLYVRNINASGNAYRYFGCSTRWGKSPSPCESKNLRADHLEEAVKDTVLNLIGELEVFRPETTARMDFTAELSDTERKLADLLVMSAGQSDGVKRALAPQIEALQDRITELSAQPVIEGETRFIGTGETYNQVFDRADHDEQRRLLIDSGIKVFASQDAVLSDSALGEMNGSSELVTFAERGPVTAWVYIPREITERTTGKHRDLQITEKTIWEEFGGSL